MLVSIWNTHIFHYLGSDMPYRINENTGYRERIKRQWEMKDA